MALCLLIVLCAPLIPIQTHRADAVFIPVYDVPNTPNQYMTNFSTVSDSVKEGIFGAFGIDTLAWGLAKMALRAMTADLVDWINNGFEGNPMFVNDPGGFFLNVGDQVIGQFIFENEDLSFLCDPISVGFDIRLALFLNFSGSFRDRISCRLTDVINNVTNASVSINNFTNGNFQQGGWDAWLAMSQVPQNNPYGQYALASNELSARVSGSVGVTKMITDWNGGFLGKVGADGIIEMPGDLIKSQLKDSFGSSQRSLEAADELGEIVNQLVGALAQQAIIGGLGSLSQSSSGNQSSYTQQLRSQDPATAFSSYGNLTPSQQNSLLGLSAPGSTQGQSYFQSTYTTQTALAQASASGASCNIQKDTAEIRLGGNYGIGTEEKATASQSCTYAGSSYATGVASLAIDGQDSSYSDSRCGNVQPSWWQLKLANPEYLSYATIQTYGATNDGYYTLNKFTGVSGLIGPWLILTADTGETKYIQLPTSQDNFTVQIPEDFIQKKVTTLRIESGGGILIREFRLFRQIRPTVEACNVPSSLTPAEALSVQPVTAAWVSAKEYPTADSVGVTLPLSNITVVVKQGEQTVIPNCPNYTYCLASGNYSFIYTAIDSKNQFMSAPVIRSVYVQAGASAPTSGDTSGPGTGGATSGTGGTTTNTEGPYTVTISVSGNGIISGGSGNCSLVNLTTSPCTALVTRGTQLTLDAYGATDSGAILSGWSGGTCSGSATRCVFNVTSDTNVTATFVTGSRRTGG